MKCDLAKCCVSNIWHLNFNLPQSFCDAQESFDLNQPHYFFCNNFNTDPLKKTQKLEYVESEMILFHNSNTREPHLTVPDHHKSRASKLSWEPLTPKPEPIFFHSLKKLLPAHHKQRELFVEQRSTKFRTAFRNAVKSKATVFAEEVVFIFYFFAWIFLKCFSIIQTANIWPGYWLRPMPKKVLHKAVWLIQRLKSGLWEFSRHTGSI